MRQRFNRYLLILLVGAFAATTPAVAQNQLTLFPPNLSFQNMAGDANPSGSTVNVTLPKE